MSLDKNTIRGKYKHFEEFVKNEQGKHRCGCGCNEVIALKESHFWNGIPRYIFGHAARLRQGAKSFDKSLYYCVEDIAEKAGVSDQTVRLWNRNGLIQADKTIGRKNLYRREDIETFLKQRPKRSSFNSTAYYSVQELKKMGVSRSKLRALARAGNIHEPRHHARKTHYLKSEIDQYLNDITENNQEKAHRLRVSVSTIIKLKTRLSDLEDRVKLLEDSLLRG
jgi:excisionase family DNA binding protein